jgi:hypothetical protein
MLLNGAVEPFGHALRRTGAGAPEAPSPAAAVEGNASALRATESRAGYG